MTWTRLVILSLVATACGSQDIQTDILSIDMRPLDCGYKWFQTGRSPALTRSCDLPRGEDLKAQQTQLAVGHAWSIAKERCPLECPPMELNDPSEWEEPFPNGACRDNHVYYTARVFFQCASMNTAGGQAAP